MGFSDYISAHRQCLLGHYLLSQVSEAGYHIPTPWPPESLSEEELDKLTEALNSCIPSDSWITDLWNWDIHFEQELEYDWYFDAVFGDSTSIESCADDLADFFLSKMDEFDMDYDQYSDPETFEELLRDEARNFITKWRANIDQRFSAGNGISR